ncbi:hypothetical protein D3C76_1218710 [compost metagenome]
MEFFSHRKIWGKFIVGTKKILRKLLRSLFMKQIQFNQKVIDQFYIVDRQLFEKDAADKEFIKNISMDMVNDIIDECKIVLEEVIHSNIESVRNLYEEDLQARINEQLSDQVNQINEQMIIVKTELYREIKTNLFKDLAQLEKDCSSTNFRYHLLLMALREDPENLEIEAEVVSAFESLNKSRLKTNDSI